MQQSKEFEHIEKKREGSQKRYRRGVKVAATGILWFFCAMLLGEGELWFGIRPFGFALLLSCAAYVPAIWAGLSMGALFFGEEPILYLCIYAAALLMRLSLSMLLDHPDAKVELRPAAKDILEQTQKTKEKTEKLHRMREAFWKSEAGILFSDLLHAAGALFTERLCLLMAGGALCALMIGLYHVIVGGFRYYDLFFTLTMVAAVPLCILVYRAALQKKETHPFLSLLAKGALLASAVWSARMITVLGFELAPVLALYFCLASCKRESAVKGILLSVLCGLAYSPLESPGCLAAALVFLFCISIGREKVGIPLSVLCLPVWSAYATGAGAWIRLLPAALFAGTAYTLSGLWLQKSQRSAEEAAGDERTAAEYRRGNDRHFRNISAAFSSLSEMLYNLSDRFRRPGTLDLRQICDTSFDAVCKQCPNRRICWGLEYADTLSAVNLLISSLHTKGKVDASLIPASMMQRCPSMEGILEGINRECARLTAEMLQNNRTEIFAMDYASAADIINDALEEEAGEYCFVPELEGHIAEYLRDAGIGFSSVTVYGNRRRSIAVYGADVDSARVTGEVLCADLGEMCGLTFAPPVFEVEDGRRVMLLRAKKQISVSGAYNNLSASGGVSGDTVNLFSNKKDYFYALICDGMGSGQEAAFTSGLCSVFLEKMLRGGNRTSTTLRMLNNMIRSRTVGSVRECSSTVDLLEIDLMRGEASFIKSGAAPSFVVRGNTVHRLQAGTAPIGIIPTLDAKWTHFSLLPGDTVVLVSDGILQDDEEGDRLREYLAKAEDMTPEALVYQICLNATNRAEHDDCSAIALRIEGEND